MGGGDIWAGSVLHSRHGDGNIIHVRRKKTCSGSEKRRRNGDSWKKGGGGKDSKKYLVQEADLFRLREKVA